MTSPLPPIPEYLRNIPLSGNRALLSITTNRTLPKAADTQPSMIPDMPPPQFDAIPGELRQLRQWINWKYAPPDPGKKKPKKIPIAPRTGQKANVTDSAIWVSFDEAMAKCKVYPEYGIGFAFTESDPYCGIDLDTCLDPKTHTIINDDVRNIILRFSSYTEISISGSGLHIIIRAKLPLGGNRKGNVEIYDTGRYFAFTGRVLSDFKTICDCQAELERYHREIFNNVGVAQISSTSALPYEDGTFPVSDDVLLEKARTAKNGDKFQQLWEGKWKDAGYPSQSEADMAFVSELVFWAGGSANWTDKLFRKSGLYRPKWDEKRGNDTYGQITIKKVLADCKNSYVWIDGQDSGNQQQFDPTDLGNAKRLIARHGQNIRYVHELRQWFIWDDRRWRPDYNSEIERLAKETLQAMLQEAVSKQTATQKEAIRHALNSQNAHRIAGMIRLAQSEPEVLLPVVKLNADPWLLGVKNGVIELKTGTFRGAKKEDYITMQAGVSYDAAAQCSNWEKFIDKYTCGDKEQVAYHQRRLGYILTGSVEAEAIFIMCGGGQNGKTTDRETLRTLLGDYAITADASLMMERKQGNGPTPEIARLHGKRLVVVSESQENQKLNEQRVKYLTSNETITARDMYKGYFDFMPTHKTVLTTNHRPMIYGSDEGIWRRIHYIESKMVISDNEKIEDFRETHLYPELPGILNWALKGLQEYLRIGLKPPPSILGAAVQYRSDMDTITHFLEQETTKDDGDSEPSQAVYERYKGWCQREGMLALGSRKLNEQLRARGYIVKAGTGNVTTVFKLKLKNLHSHLATLPPRASNTS